ncbi:MAG TPA: AmmeMemoRadiSam system protein B [bacterium]|nr:AmmeMemoRadiSam system protein B [bacterium]HOL48648.1 AmmeMemoRadiSam system protein B [bacterium]HPQ19775.1 AmmeMemoRadiSam system protein B [bacterium]
MKSYFLKRQIIIFLFFLILSNNCNSKEKVLKKENKIREPVAAGKFYPDKPEELRQMVEYLFSKAERKKFDNVRAFIVPHAGYIFSGIVAASGYNQINTNKNYNNIFLIGSSHYAAFNGASIYNSGDYKTPFGLVKVNIELADELIKKYDFIFFKEEAELYEHSLEVQLPFLQYIFKKEIRIVPIIIGTDDLNILKKLSSALKEYFTEDNLFIISTDFSHYPDYNNAVEVDKNIGLAIQKKNINFLLSENNKYMNKGIPKLACCICGLSSVITLLNMIEVEEEYKIEHIQYMNSGDVSGDKSRVVGYHSFVVLSNKKEEAKIMSKEKEFVLTEKDKKDLLKVARETIVEYIKNNKIPEFKEKEFSENLLKECGAFVTLHKHGNLRGCIGRFMADEPLYKVVQEMAIASSTQDYRFSKVSVSELSEIDIEISVLSPLKKVKSIDEIELGKHGIYIVKGFRSGTFLPQVAKETGWSKEEFLGHCARDKAGIGWDGWKDADIYIYTADVFSEIELGLFPKK